jgi:hypothetical protein
MVMMFMAESPDRRLIEPGANMVNERLPGNFERRAWAAASHVLPARARANVTVLDILLDYRLYFSYDAKISLIEGRIPDAICNVERVRCFRAGSQPAPERLRASFPSVLRPRRGVLSLDWDRIGRVTPAGFFSCA